MKPLPVFERPLARRDVLELALHLAEEGSLAIAQAFLDAIGTSYDRLSRHPELGPIRHLPRLADIRMSRIRGFPNHFILDTIRSDRVEIVRVLHGARELGSIEG